MDAVCQVTKKDGCGCTPLYHVVTRHAGKLIREPVGHNRKEAERALDAHRGDIARRKYRVVENIRFDEWADRWIASLRAAGRKECTVRVYEVSLAYAKDAFGSMNIREIQPSDISAMLDGIANKPRTLKKVTQSTLAKHLRQLGSCLAAAVSEGYAEDNPVSRLHSTRRPKVTRSAPAYFTDEELSRLWPELDDLPLYSYLCRIALATGMRSGELVALRWSDVSMTTSEVIVSRTYDAGVGETPTKSGKTRTVICRPKPSNCSPSGTHLAAAGTGSCSRRRRAGISTRTTSSAWFSTRRWSGPVFPARVSTAATAPFIPSATPSPA